jgi:hypothetical protein
MVERLLVHKTMHIYIYTLNYVLMLDLGEGGGLAFTIMGGLIPKSPYCIFWQPTGGWVLDLVIIPRFQNK